MHIVSCVSLIHNEDSEDPGQTGNLYLAQSPHFREAQTKARGGEVTFSRSLNVIAGTKRVFWFLILWRAVATLHSLLIIKQTPETSHIKQWPFLIW